MNRFAEAINALQALADGVARQLDGSDGMEPSWHLWKAAEVNAVIAALGAGRPLLVRGEPGTGKTQLARAAAAALGWQLHPCALHARSEAQDVLYQFDAVRRLADAQAGRLGEDESRYWQPQALWRAFDWHSAQNYGSLRAGSPGTAPPPASAPLGHVVLIDEIDKAPPDVPNGLLEVLGARRFDIAALGLTIKAGQPGVQAGPLVIITTNEERELPPAFMRRCMVLVHGNTYPGGYRQFLVEHGLAHFGTAGGRTAHIDPALLAAAAAQLEQDRERAQQAQLTPPGLAEYLDLLYALHRLAPGDAVVQAAWLDRLNPYAYLKNRNDEGAANALTQTGAVRAIAPVGVIESTGASGTSGASGASGAIMSPAQA